MCPGKDSKHKLISKRSAKTQFCSVLFLEHNTQSCSFHSESINSLGSRGHFRFSSRLHHFEVSPVTGEAASPGEGSIAGRLQAGAGQAGHTCAAGGACLPGPGMGPGIGPGIGRSVLCPEDGPLHAQVVQNKTKTS